MKIKIIGTLFIAIGFVMYFMLMAISNLGNALANVSAQYNQVNAQYQAINAQLTDLSTQQTNLTSHYDKCPQFIGCVIPD